MVLSTLATWAVAAASPFVKKAAGHAIEAITEGLSEGATGLMSKLYDKIKGVFVGDERAEDDMKALTADPDNKAAQEAVAKQFEYFVKKDDALKAELEAMFKEWETETAGTTNSYVVGDVNKAIVMQNSSVGASQTTTIS
jgi:hypothetical protein